MSQSAMRQPPLSILLSIPLFPSLMDPLLRTRDIIFWFIILSQLVSAFLLEGGSAKTRTCTHLYEPALSFSYLFHTHSSDRQSVPHYLLQLRHSSNVDRLYISRDSVIIIIIRRYFSLLRALVFLLQNSTFSRNTTKCVVTKKELTTHIPPPLGDEADREGVRSKLLTWSVVQRGSSRM
jgi:hypothetical protein